MSHRYSQRTLSPIATHCFVINKHILLLPHAIMLFCILTQKPYCCTLFSLIVSEVVILSSRCAMTMSICAWSLIKSVSCAKRCAMNSTIMG